MDGQCTQLRPAGVPIYEAFCSRGILDILHHQCSLHGPLVAEAGPSNGPQDVSHVDRHQVAMVLLGRSCIVKARHNYGV